MILLVRKVAMYEKGEKGEEGMTVLWLKGRERKVG